MAAEQETARMRHSLTAIAKGKENVWTRKAREASEEAKRRNRKERVGSANTEANISGPVSARIHQRDLREATKSEQYRTIAEKERSRSGATRRETPGKEDVYVGQEDQTWPSPMRNEVHVHRILFLTRKNHNH